MLWRHNTFAVVKIIHSRNRGTKGLIKDIDGGLRALNGTVVRFKAREDALLQRYTPHHTRIQADFTSLLYADPICVRDSRALQGPRRRPSPTVYNTIRHIKHHKTYKMSGRQIRCFGRKNYSQQKPRYKGADKRHLRGAACAEWDSAFQGP